MFSPRLKGASGRTRLPICVVGLLFGLQAATCEPAQQQRAGANELSQDSFAMPAPDGLAAFGSYGPAGGYLNSKRARKMSAFMPMRGRKDGRDALRQAEQLNGFHLELPNLAALGRELEPSGELSALRLMGRPLFGELDGRPAVPRQFMEQLEQMARPRALVEAGSGQAFGSPVGAPIEAKYRRAFHPMRGKKSGPQMGRGADDESESGEPAAFMQELGGEPFDSLT